MMPEGALPPCLIGLILLISSAGNSWSSICYFWKTIFPGLLQPHGGDHGHDDPHQQLSQLHPLLPHVLAVQSISQEDFL